MEDSSPASQNAEPKDCLFWVEVDGHEGQSDSTSHEFEASQSSRSYKGLIMLIWKNYGYDTLSLGTKTNYIKFRASMKSRNTIIVQRHALLFPLFRLSPYPRPMPLIGCILNLLHCHPTGKNSLNTLCSRRLQSSSLCSDVHCCQIYSTGSNTGTIKSNMPPLMAFITLSAFGSSCNHLRLAASKGYARSVLLCSTIWGSTINISKEYILPCLAVWLLAVQSSFCHRN
jgi:hypothetical protein